MELILDVCHDLFPSPFSTILLCSLIVCTCISGDHLVAISQLSDWSGNGNLKRALIDNSTHALIGALVWALVENVGLLIDWRKWLNCVFCALLAASVDLDHFLAAGAFDLQKALNLPKRPPFHNSSLTLIVAVLLWLFYYKRYVLRLFSLMFFSSWFSHHLRDSNHRGLWFFPFDHTPVIPSFMYMTLIILLGVSVRILYFYGIYNTKLKNGGSATFMGSVV